MLPKRVLQYRKEFRDYYFDKEAADRIVRFYSKELRHLKGECAGQHFELEPWQAKILRRVFGWKHKVTHLRKYRVLYIEIPRKNGKSALGSGLALYMLDADNEPGAEVVSAAADKEQAALVFDAAKEMVLANYKLSSRIKPFRRSMVVYQTGSTYKVLSSEVKNKHGTNLSAIIADEVHAMPSRDLLDVLTSSMAYRAQPLTALLTTAGFDRNSICWEYHDYAKRVHEGVVEDPAFYGVIFAASPDDDWKDEKVWKKANPNWGVSVRPEFLREEFKKAREIPAYENTFKRLHLNIWTEQDSRWMPIELWDSCAGGFTAESLKGQTCFGGLDLSTTTDLAALNLLFPQPGGRFKTLSYFFAPEDTIRRRSQKDRVPYDQWTREGFIEKTPGAICDYDFIRRRLNELRDIFNIEEVAIDPWNATQLATQLEGDDFTICFTRQGFGSLSAPTKELSALILGHKIEHNNNPVMRWCVRNIAIEQDAAGNIKPSKKRSKDRIDGIAALINGLSRAILHKDTGPSVYETQDVFVI